MRLYSLSNRLLLVTAIALLPSLLIVSVGAIQLKRAAEAALHQKSLRSAELMSLELDRIVSGAENILLTISAAPAVQRGDLEQCSSVLEDVVKKVAFLASIVVINPDGRVRCIPNPSQGLPDLADRSYVGAALATRARVVGEYTIGRRTKRRVLPIALQIGGAADEPRGVAVAFISLDWLEERLRDRTYETGSSLTIADRGGTILARMPEPERFVGTVIPDEYRYLVTMPAPGTLVLISQDGTRRVVGYFPATSPPFGLYVSAGHSTAVAFAPYRKLATTAGAIALAGITVAFLLARYTSQAFIAKPVSRVLTTIAAWRAGDQTARTTLSDQDGEICAAGRSLDELLDELAQGRTDLEKAETRSKTLSAELDHRIKNLLTMVQIIARRTFTSHEYSETLRIFSNRVTALSEANSLLRRNEWQSAKMLTLVTKTIEPFVDPSTPRIEIAGPDVPVKGTIALALAMALHELATNASKYGSLSDDAGSVTIRWFETTGPDARFVLTWAETGGPKVEPPTRKGFGSTVVEQVLSAQTGGSVELSYSPGGFTCIFSAPIDNVRENVSPATRSDAAGPQARLDEAETDRLSG